MSWKIHAINNDTGKVIISDERDKRTSLTIPAEHQTAEQKNSYIKGHMNQYGKYNKILKIVYILAAFSLLELSLFIGLFLRHK